MLGYLAIGLSLAVGAVPASLAQDSRALDRCKPAGTGSAAEERQTHQSDGNAVVLVDLPLGKVCVGPELLDGEHSYVRRTKAKEGMAIVEVSTTPFMPVEPLGALALVGRTDQPAPW